MTKNKVEALNELRAVIETKGTIQYRYHEEGCFCAVGHLMNVCGVNISELLDENTKDNGCNINSLSYKLKDNEDFKKVTSLFTIDELDELQGINDKDTNEVKRNEELMKYIDIQLEELKK